MNLWIKICGVTSVEDALFAARAGANAVGVNFVPSSKRFVSVATARAIMEALPNEVETIAVVADFGVDALRTLVTESGVRRVQLHGNEPPAIVEALGELAYQAVRIATAADVERARSFGGSLLLADAKVEGALGGTGHVFDWELVRGLAAERPLVLAGGLTAENVATAVERVRPYGVDTASGVETSNPRAKDRALVTRFIEAARRAAAALDTGAPVDYLPSRNP
jgi:phosphoribosylanthranilate isomerase